MAAASATVGKLFQHLKSVTPKEPVYDIETELPLDPDITAKLLQLRKEGKYKECLVYMHQTHPSKGHNVYNNLFIGGKKTTQVQFPTV